MTDFATKSYESRRWSRLTIVSIVLLVLLGLVMFVSYMWGGEPDPDRPPIIVSTGSVIVDSGGDWTDEGGNNFVEKLKGKSLKDYSASTGSATNGTVCTVAGKTIVVTYGSSDITFSRKSRWPWPGAKHDASVQFPAGATVSGSSPGELVVTTGDALVTFKNNKGDSCTVVDQRIELRQMH